MPRPDLRLQLRELCEELGQLGVDLGADGTGSVLALICGTGGTMWGAGAWEGAPISSGQAGRPEAGERGSSGKQSASNAPP